MAERNRFFPIDYIFLAPASQGIQNLSTENLVPELFMAVLRLDSLHDPVFSMQDPEPHNSIYLTLLSVRYVE